MYPYDFPSPQNRPIINIGVPTGGAAPISSLDKSGGNAEYSPKDFIISALANVGQRAGTGAGLIPALLGGIGEAYMMNKQAQALNQKAIQDDLIRRNSQAALAQFMGNVPPEYIQAMASANPEVLKAFITAAGNNANRDSYQQGIKEIGSGVQLAPGTTTEALMNIFPQLTGYQEKLPGMTGQNLKNQYTEATMPGAISGTNAENLAKTKYAVPMAGAKLQGQQLTNTHQGQVNKFYPQIQQQNLQKGNLDMQGQRLQNQHQGQINQFYPQSQHQQQQLRNMQIQKQRAVIQEMSTMKGLDDTFQQIFHENPDPQIARGLSMEVLRTAPVSAQGKEAAMRQLDDMTIMRMQGLKAENLKKQQTQQKNQPTKKPSGLFGLSF